MTNVFVYGSLRKGFHNHYLLERSTILHDDAVITGTMASLGGFPCVTTEGNNQIHGEIYEVDDPTLADLDRLEGHPSFYCREVVRSSKGDVWVYLIKDSSYYNGGYPLVKDGVWRGPSYKRA